MNSSLKTIQQLLQQNNNLSGPDKEALLKAITDADKQWGITEFKLDRTEKVKRTTAILLEETIEELEQKRKAVEEQNRELEIGNSLERVRTVAMGMQRLADMPEICRVISQQLESLGIKEIRNVQTAIFHEDKGTYTNYEYYRLHDKMLITEVDYTSDKISTDFATEMIAGTNQVFTRSLAGQALKDWFNFQKTTNVFIDTHLENAGSLNYYWFSLGPVALGISTYHPLNEEEIDLFKRFRNVFELSYRRYLDIEKAEAQARESQIQLAMERVRARTMAMQCSDELLEAASLLFKQIADLGTRQWSSGFDIWNANEVSAVAWMTNPDGSIGVPFTVPYTEDPFFKQIYAAKQRGEDFFVMESSGKELEETYQYLFNLPEAKKHFDGVKSLGFQMPKFQITHCAFFSQGYLMFITFESAPEMWDIFKRFAKVFEQTYTRFLDLQTAEAQAREAEIELGLERVRARAMAMQSSGELSDLVDTVFKELTKLDFALTWCIINIIDESSMSNTVWAANPDIDKAPESYHMLFEDYPFHDAMMKGWKERKTKYVYTLEGSEKKIYDDYLFSETEFKRTPEAAQAASRAMEKYVVSFSFSNFGGLQTVGDAPLSDANLDILSRFGKVFDLTYTRFNDLKQAEAQARESQIQLALERVRARTMAMQKSNELPDAALLLSNQVKELGVQLWGTSFQLWDEDKKEITVWSCIKDTMISPFKVPATEDPLYINIFEANRKGESLYAEEFGGERLENHIKYMMSISGFREGFLNVLGQGVTPPESLIFHATYFSNGFVLYISLRPCPEAHDIFKRFAKVFEQTYTRFLDLQKAEAQAREAKIEAALEKVRSRSLAMHKSDELSEVVTILFEKIKELQIPVNAVGIGIYIDGSKDMNTYVCGENEDRLVINNYCLPFFHHRIWKDLNNAREKQLDFFSGNYSKEEKNSFYKYVSEHSALRHLPDDIKSLIFESPAYTISMAPVNHSMFMINDFEGKILSGNEVDIIKRFARVFDQAYTRFLDLQKAEAQARESQIQLALERARSQSMIMQHSKELDDVLRVFHEQVLLLDIKSAFSFLWLPDENKDRHIFWAAWSENNSFKSKAIDYPLDRNEPATAQCLIDWKSSEPVVSYHVPPDGVENYFAAWQELIAGVEQLKPEHFSDGLYYVEAFMKFGCFGVMVKSELPEEEKKILARFATEFERAYTRFLDLQKAEAQAREAQIEAALERVRSRTMGMQHSSELQGTALLLFQQILVLDVPQLGCGFNIWDDDKKAFTSWMGGGLGENTRVPPFKVSSSEDVFLLIYEAAERGESLFVKEQGGEELVTHYRYMFSMPVWKQIMGDFTPPTFQVIHCAFFAQGFLMFVSPEPIPDAHDIFKRFAKVFEQTYTRFLDLQKSEAQARESKIEAALERVRSRTMAMQKSDELQNTALLLFQQVQALGVPSFACGFNIWDDDRKAATAWMARENALQPAFKTSSSEDVFFHIHKAAEKGESLFVAEQGGKVLETHYRYMASIPIFGDVMEKMAQAGLSVPAFQIIHCAFFSQGYLMFISYEPVPFAYDIFKRFAKVFEQTYTRFLDLQKAEAQALEALKRASVDRVRAEIASMRTTTDLEKITPLIWNELTTLGVPFIRCGVFIMDEEQQQVHTFLSTPEGKAIAAFHLPFNTQQTSIRNLPEYWRKKKMFTDHWDEAAFKASTKNLIESGAITSPGEYLTEHPPTDLYLHFLPFLQGMLYVGNSASLNEDELQLVQNLADAFSTAYARYEDFNKLEVAKQTVEKTLTDLKQAQTQLVQAEKMASLGELTAGIAHEIQNPLNFVNNFSDVSNELLDEMKVELKKGNADEAMFIAEDVKQNLEKILHHGKRADAIVKGMLQHSRTSSGQKELTDINALCDEYLRLAFHGLRAKDKSFNAKFETDFDSSVGKINVIPQEIGRVILNLINNAFYAVGERRRVEGIRYEPTVTVKTSKNPPLGGRGAEVLISVKDNGNGIPQKVFDKIFQPFFTTKPTGQGTGLGLSLSYDIITKGHGGELKVETKEGEGSEFIILLPVT